MERLDRVTTHQLIEKIKIASPKDTAYLLSVLQLRKDAGPAIADLIRDADPELKLTTITLLDKQSVAEYEVVRALVDALRDKDSRIRQQAAIRLGDSKRPEAVEPLMNQTDDPEVSVQKEAIRALGKIGDARASKILTKQLTSKDEDIRWSAVVALDKLHETSSIDTLIAALADRVPSVRERIVRTLGRLGQQQPAAIVQALIPLLRDPDASVRDAVVMALGELGDTLAVAPLIEAMLNNMSAMIVADAAIALGKLGDRRAVKSIEGLLSNKNTDVRSAAAEALAELGDPVAIPALKRALAAERNLEMRQHFQACIAAITHPSQKVVRGATPREQWLYRTWLENPTLDAGSEMYTFHEDGTGEVEDFHMGITRDHRRFTYRVSGEVISLLFAKRKRWVQTRFNIERSTYLHPVEGNLPSLKLVFEEEPYFIEFGPVRNSTYYYIL